MTACDLSDPLDRQAFKHVGASARGLLVALFCVLPYLAHALRGVVEVGLGPVSLGWVVLAVRTDLGELVAHGP
jgi:hypothetical protein